MKKDLFVPYNYGPFFLFFCMITVIYAPVPVCDITDLISRQLNQQAFTIWSLLDLAEHNHIVDHELFYDELCHAALTLCKEVQVFKESGYQLTEPQADTFAALVTHLHNRFKQLPAMIHYDTRYSHAVDVILEYTRYFLKNDLCIEPNQETTHSGL